MKTKWLNSDNAIIELDSTEYMAIVSALTSLPYISNVAIMQRIQEHMADQISSFRNKVKQKERLK